MNVILGQSYQWYAEKLKPIWSNTWKYKQSKMDLEVSFLFLTIAVRHNTSYYNVSVCIKFIYKQTINIFNMIMDNVMEKYVLPNKWTGCR